MCNATELRAVDLSSSHQFEEVIGAASSENWLFMPQMEFSVQTGGRRGLRGHRHGLGQARRPDRPGLWKVSGPLFGLLALDDNADHQAAAVAAVLHGEPGRHGKSDGGSEMLRLIRVRA